MSKRETPLTRRFWVGKGTLILEYRAVRGTADQGQRLIDAVIIPDGPSKEAHWRDVSLECKDVIAVQTKDSRLGMYLLGQALFTRALLMRYCGARSVRTVALCTKDDAALNPIATEMGIEVVVMDPNDPRL